MNFTIAFHHRRSARLFLIKVERDAIFIAYPKWKNIRDEAIFLTKTNGQWVGDSADKKLVEKIGREIDDVYKQAATPKRKFA